jgi:hypothetical protein
VRAAFAAVGTDERHREASACGLTFRSWIFSERA